MAKKPRSPGWLSTDEEEVERRRRRGAEERFVIRPLEPAYPVFGTFRVRSLDARASPPSKGRGGDDAAGDAGDAGDGAGRSYTVEINALGAPTNLCDCPDHRVNGLGTCKHVEAVLHGFGKSRRGGKGRRAGPPDDVVSPRVEIFLDRAGDRVRVVWPARMTARAAARRLIAPFFDSAGTLLSDPLDGLPALRRALDEAPKRVREQIRVSQLLGPWLRRRRQRRQRDRDRDRFLADVAAGKRSVDVLKARLLPYQVDGMLHLAFTERALLADDMGLGKTIQALGACELLRRLRDVARVLVIAPASLKAEWEEQIGRFSGLPARLVLGDRRARREQYRQPAFFYLCNYEQVLSDGAMLNEILAPDVIVLDEAQRIKNWNTKTAAAVKRLASRYAFVLTGTPLENRIDEVYSIVQFLDPAIFGPLFRFNREFYQLDEAGRPTGYKNLDLLHRRLRPVMLRRRKREVEQQLPSRSEKTFLVRMHPEQTARYDEYATVVARLMNLAARRPLLPKELERLQQALSCMRMLCDTPYILDPECWVSPKIDELRTVLPELLEAPECKIIVFSEWERMLVLVAELAEELDVGYAWHTGSVPQKQRRGEVRAFKDDPGCRLFLSTDAGSVGLNLQVASVVINMDLPWNPAKLEQRIARAWRKHQTRPVQVLNFVSEETIEERMLDTLARKQTLAASVIDAGGPTSIELRGGRQAMIERVEQLLGRPAAEPTGVADAKADAKVNAVADANADANAGISADADGAPGNAALERLKQDALARLSDRLQRLQVYPVAGTAGGTVLAVVDRTDPGAREVVERAARRLPSTRLELLDQDAYATICRLVEAGVLRFNDERAATLVQPPAEARRRGDDRRRRLREARRRLAAAERPQRLAEVLGQGGFPAEALPPLREAVEVTLQAMACALGEPTVSACNDSDGGGVAVGPPVAAALIRDRLLPARLLPAQAPRLIERLRTGTAAGSAAVSDDEAATLLRDGQALLVQAREALDRL